MALKKRNKKHLINMVFTKISEETEKYIRNASVENPLLNRNDNEMKERLSKATN